MTQDYVPGGDPIVFTMGEVVNPKSTRQVEGLQIILMATEGTGTYAIDEYSGITPWQLTTGDMANVRVNPAGNSVAYSTDLAYEFVFSPKHDIPLDGFVEITIPS